MRMKKSKDLCGDLLYGFDFYSIVKHRLCQILINSECRSRYTEIKWVKISQRIDTYLSLLCVMFITGQIACQITAALEQELVQLMAFYG